MHIRLLTMLLPVALLAAPDTSTVDSSRTFLRTAFELSALEITRLDRGEVISRTLDVKNRREVATLGIVWINTSPNLRSVNEASLYPGVALVEGTNVSVGRGTDTPFEVMGAPWIDYVVTDRFATPNALQQAFTERLLPLPDCYCPSDTRREVAASAESRAEFWSLAYSFCARLVAL